MTPRLTPRQASIRLLWPPRSTWVNRFSSSAARLQTVEVVRNEPGAEFVGFEFEEPFTHLGAYIINTYPDEPSNVNVFYEGRALFDSMGEEDFYDLEDAPTDAKLLYARQADLGDGDVQVMGMTSESVLQAILPRLRDDAKYRDHAHFMQVAGAEFRAYWGR